ncbi:hypothetical protein EGR_05247 [Echinococcus granulosus]|uniref:Uncharacterized protein n=1 Tax=Echinococcus granulosus TaxID=6210 RepID=W6UG06_ECHGR|nr:hypothetical protein EGR_05247 [Echinococcus granulosus]EUB59921.1 hypothetical protein EGR_05247 [Echinococcus granulosus]
MKLVRLSNSECCTTNLKKSRWIAWKLVLKNYVNKSLHQASILDFFKFFCKAQLQKKIEVLYCSSTKKLHPLQICDKLVTLTDMQNKYRIFC